MASSFPGAIDSFTDPLSNSPLNSPSHSAQHADLNDAAEKIETFVLDLPRGIVAYGESTTSIGAVSAETLSVTSSSFTAVANRYYKITYNEPTMIFATGSVLYIDLNIRLTNLAGTLLQNSSFLLSSANRNAGIVTLVRTFTAGATIVCGCFDPEGGGTASSFHSSVARAAIVVEDIGKL